MESVAKAAPAPESRGGRGDEIAPAEIWQEPAARILARLDATPAGLDDATAQARLAIWGANDATAGRTTPLWLQFLSRFRNPLIIILLVASALSAATGEVASFIIVTAIVLASLTLDFVQEVRAHNAVEALRRSVAGTASVREKPPATAFAVGIHRFGMLITRVTVLMVLFVLVVNISFQRPLLESLMFALALAVGLTPELLPMIVTVTLARSAMDLARRQVIVKRLSAIHDLGAMDVLCTDKTGTLTEAEIKLGRTI